jgi:hypothetical protein
VLRALRTCASSWWCEWWRSKASGCRFGGRLCRHRDVDADQMVGIHRSQFKEGAKPAGLIARPRDVRGSGNRGRRSRHRCTAFCGIKECLEATGPPALRVGEVAVLGMQGVSVSPANTTRCSLSERGSNIWVINFSGEKNGCGRAKSFMPR